MISIAEKEVKMEINQFIQRLIQGFPESVNPNYKYSFFFKDKINGFAFTTPIKNRVIINIPRLLEVSNQNMEIFASLVLMNLYHETQHTYQFEYMKKHNLNIIYCLKSHKDALEKQAINAMQNLKYDYDFSYLHISL